MHRANSIQSFQSLLNAHLSPLACVDQIEVLVKKGTSDCGVLVLIDRNHDKYIFLTTGTVVFGTASGTQALEQALCSVFLALKKIVPVRSLSVSATLLDELGSGIRYTIPTDLPICESSISDEIRKADTSARKIFTQS